MLAEIFVLRLEAERRVLEMAVAAKENRLHRSRGRRAEPARRKWRDRFRHNVRRGLDSSGFLFGQLRRRAA